MTRTILVVVGLMGWLVGCGSAAQTPADNGGSGVVELLRDPWHVPHILADSDEGAMYGLGYACAQEPALQMYYTVRIIQGRSAEMLGDRKRSNANETTVQQEPQDCARSGGSEVPRSQRRGWTRVRACCWRRTAPA